MRRFSPLLRTVAVVGCLQAAQPVDSRFDGARAFEDVRQMVAIGPRVAGSEGAQAARDYIRKQLQAAGVTVEEQPFEAETPLGRVKMVNLRATFPAAPGATSQGRLIIGGHYDTKLFKEFTFVGANDGGLERGIPDRAGAHTQDANQPGPDRAAVPRRRGSDR